MIRSITVTNHLNEFMRIDLFNPQETGLIIQSIEGLGPPKANVNFTELATSDGAIDNTARLDSRNIVLSFLFASYGGKSIEDIRQSTYKYFPIKRNVKIVIETDNRNCETIGRVESNTPTIFSKEEGCQISIMCPDPYLYSEGTETFFYSMEPMFTFPFSNESLFESLIMFGNIKNQTVGTLAYTGDAETGIIIRIHAIGSAEGLAIYNLDTRESLKINDSKLIALLGSGIMTGDDITINTNKGQKSITLLRGGTTTNILNTLESPIKWFQIFKGDNVFAYTCISGISNLQVVIENKVVFEGV